MIYKPKKKKNAQSSWKLDRLRKTKKERIEGLFFKVNLVILTFGSL